MIRSRGIILIKYGNLTLVLRSTLLFLNYKYDRKDVTKKLFPIFGKTSNDSTFTSDHNSAGRQT